MSHPAMNRIPILNKFVDERFLEHRRRSSSAAGIIAGCLAIALFEYRFFANHIWDWGLLSIELTFVVIKLTMMTWYRIRDSIGTNLVCLRMSRRSSTLY